MSLRSFIFIFVLLVLPFKAFGCEEFFDNFKHHDSSHSYQDMESRYTFNDTLTEAKQGYKGAAYNVGIMYLIGFGVKEDFGEAFYWLNSSSNRNSSRASYALGCLYYDGFKVKQDYTKSYNYFFLASKTTNKDAEFMVGEMLSKGQGVKQNFKESFEYIKRSALKGQKQAIRKMGLMYYNGIGTEKDNYMAYIWFKRVIDELGDDVGHMITLLRKEMSGSEIMKAERTYGKWRGSMYQKM